MILHSVLSIGYRLVTDGQLVRVPNVKYSIIIIVITTWPNLQSEDLSTQPGLKVSNLKATQVLLHRAQL